MFRNRNRDRDDLLRSSSSSHVIDLVTPPRVTPRRIPVDVLYNSETTEDASTSTTWSTRCCWFKQVKEPNEEEVKCGINFDVCLTPSLTSCGHLFDFRSITNALLFNNRCPSCRTPDIKVEKPCEDCLNRWQNHLIKNSSSSLIKQIRDEMIELDNLHYNANKKTTELDAREASFSRRSSHLNAYSSAIADREIKVRAMENKARQDEAMLKIREDAVRQREENLEIKVRQRENALKLREDGLKLREVDVRRIEEILTDTVEKIKHRDEPREPHSKRRRF